MSGDLRVLAGRYRLVSVLGRGGMGQVWLAEDETLGRQVAVKEVRFPSDLPEHERDVSRQRTLREARLTARLSHTSIVAIYDVVSEDGRPFIVMELVRAPSLAALIDMEGQLQPDRVAGIALQLLDALDVAHAAGVIHRDIKPSNVLLADERVVLTDFGIATSETDAGLTTTGMIVGSPTYMSPERLRSEGIGPAGDMWSLGATLYAALEGHPPFRASNVMGTITSVLTDPPPPPGVEGPLRDAILGLLHKAPDERLTSAQLRPLLERAVTSESPAIDPEPDQAATRSVPVMAPAVDDDLGSGSDPNLRWHPTPAPAAGPPAARRHRPGARTLAAAFGIAVLVGLLVGLVLVFGDEDTPTSGSTGGSTSEEQTSDPATTGDPESTQSTQSTESTEPSESDVPDGYRLVRDPLDFTVAVPEDWTRRLEAAGRVDFVSPDGTQFLRVEQRPQALPDAEQAWLDLEPSVANLLSGYSRIRIEPVEFRGWEAADWEFIWEGDNGTVHVLDRGFITDPRGFALYMSGPDDAWDDESLPIFEAAADTFKPSA